MNYDQPRQVDVNADRPDAGKWRWTTRNDNNVRPDGYCSPLELCPDCKGHSGIIRPDVDCVLCGNRGMIDVAEPCPGHDTAEEAAEHYRQYRIDRAEFMTGPTAERLEVMAARNAVLDAYGSLAEHQDECEYDRCGFVTSKDAECWKFDEACTSALDRLIEAARADERAKIEAEQRL